MYRRLALLGIGFLLCFGIGGPQPAHGDYFALPNTRAKDFAIVQKDGLWHIVAINAPIDPPPGSPYSPGLEQATSRDLLHWTDGGVAIPVGAPGTWDSFDTWAPSIVESQGTYYLYYTGVQLVNNVWVQKIGLATSTDLVTWTKSGANPVFDCSQTPWQYWDPTVNNGYSTDCRDPYVIRDEANGRWLMFYNGRLQNDQHQHQVPQPAYWIQQPAVVGMAASTDLINWTDAGFVSATASYQTESPHLYLHDGTWHLIFTSNCTFSGTTKCIVHSTAPALSGPYTGFADFPSIYSWHFASEAFTDEQGRELFGSSDGAIRFYDMDWSSGALELVYLPRATFVGAVWLDSNRNGQLDGFEDGLDNVFYSTYLDNGDGVFSATDDYFLIRSRTLYVGRDGVRQHGTYRTLDMPVGRVWLAINDENFAAGQPLAGMTSTTGEMYVGIDVTGNGTLNTKYFGFAPPDTTAPAGVSDLR